MEDQVQKVQRVDFSELGSSGLTRFGNRVYEEFLPALKGTKAMKVYKEMSMNDPTIGAIFFAAEQLCRRASWRVEAQGTSQVDLEAKEFLESCMHDMSMTWSDLIAEILSMLPFGWSWHEIVYKKREGDVRDPKGRSRYNDGRIGWRKIPGRAQETLHEWQFDEDGGIEAMVQIAPPDFRERVIPIEKSLLFRTKADKNNPEGRSMLRNAYRPWYFKKHIEEIEGIGIERDLAGLPVLIPPEGVDLWNSKDEDAVKLRQHAEKLVRNIRRDQNEGIVLPFGWELKLLSTGSRRQFDTNAILNRYDQRIAITILADMVLLGADKVGSFALADVKKGLFAAALEAWMDSIADVFNRYGVPRLFALNTFPGLQKLPKLVHGEIETPDLSELAKFISALSGAGMNLFPNLDLENYLREIASMPQKSEEQYKTELEERKERLKLLARKQKAVTASPTASLGNDGGDNDAI
jgi:hypothetical protein